MSRGRILIIILLIFVAISGVVWIFYNLNFSNKQNNAKPENQINTNKPLPLPIKITNVSNVLGIIERIDVNVITFRAPKSSNSFLDEDKIFKASLDKDTKIILNKGAMPFDVNNDENNISVTSGNFSTPKEKQKPLKLSDLKIGGWAMFVTNENILTKQTFMAREIYYLSIGK